MDAFKSSIVAFAILFWIKKSYANSELISSYLNHYRREGRTIKAINRCEEILATKFDIDDDAGPKNFKKALKEMSIPELQKEFSKPMSDEPKEKEKINSSSIPEWYVNDLRKVEDSSSTKPKKQPIVEESDKKTDRIFKRELLISYMKNISKLIDKIDLKNVETPDKWCINTQVQKVSEQNMALNKESLEMDCLDYSNSKLRIGPMTGKKSVNEYISGLDVKIIYNVYPYDERHDLVFDSLYYQWSENSINFKNIFGNDEKDIEKKQKLEFLIQQFSLGYFLYFNKFVDDCNFVNISYKDFSVGEFCDNSALKILQQIEKGILGD